MATATLPLTYHAAVNGTAPASSCPELQAQLWHITPEVARELLKNARPNRALSKARVRVLIADIRAGRWRVNGESIILDQDLRMIDGQHRCAAIAEAGITVDVLVVVGVSPDVAMSIDQGRAKVGGDMLHMAGLDQAQTLASTARWLYRYERNQMRQVTVPLRHDELPAYVAARPSLPGSLPWGRLVRDLLPQSCASMLYFVMGQKESALAKRYFDDLAHGDGLTREHPAHVVREKLLRDKSPKNHLGVVSRAALIVLGWSCLRKEQPLPAGVTWKGVTDEGAAFPQVV